MALPSPCSLKRFEHIGDMQDNREMYDEAKLYGAGAFSWNIDDAGVRWLVFRHPAKGPDFCGTPASKIGAVPVNGSETPVWDWNGDEDNPTLRPSVLFYYTHPQSRQQVTIWHGFIRNGQIETVEPL